MQPFLPAEFHKSQRPVVRGHGYRIFAAQINHISASAFQKVLCRQTASLAVIALDSGGSVLQETLNSHQRHIQITEAFGFHTAAAENNPRYTAGLAHLHIFILFFIPFPGIKKQKLVSVLVSRCFQTAQQPGKIRMIDMRNDYTYGIGCLFGKGTCQLIGLIIQPFHGIINLFPCIAADIPPIIQYPGHRTDSQPGLFCHIFQCCHHCLRFYVSY